MIHVPRTAKPPILQQNEQTWLAELRAADAAVHIAATEIEREEARKAFKKKQGRYAHPEIREALESMFGTRLSDGSLLVKCAFCESHISHISDEHIEHFRPKSTYLSDTYSWENLLIACLICNRDYKKTHFPIATDGTSLLLDPTVDYPENHLDFVWDNVTQLATVVPTNQQGDVTERILGLNRGPLREVRSNNVRKLACLARLATTDPEAYSLFIGATQTSAEYAAFARALAAQVGIACS